MVFAKTLLWLLALTAAAAAPRARCPGGIAPRFTGDPFAPVGCSTAAAAAVPEPQKPSFPKGQAAPGLKEFSGGWRGVVATGLERYEVLLRLRPVSRDSWRGVLQTQNYQTLNRRIMTADLKSKGGGRYAGPVALDVLPDQPLQATLYLGAGSKPADGEMGFDRELLLVYQDVPGGHRVRLVRQGKDVLRFLYWNLGKPDAPIEGSLTATDKDSL
jgi:hypothetical protein